MQLVLLGHTVDIRVRKVLLWSVILLFASLIGAFAIFFVRSYISIQKNGPLSSWTNERLDSSVSSVITNTKVTVEDLKLLAKEDRPSLGPTPATLTVVVFLDYECPFCRRAAGAFRETMVKYQGNVRFIMRDFPIEDIHPNAFQAAHAARCAFAQGKGWAYHDTLFARQESQSTQDLERYATQAGLDMNKYRDCMDRQSYAASIREDVVDGLRVGVSGTPTYFFNGIRIQGVPEERTTEFFDQLIQTFLRETPQGSGAVSGPIDLPAEEE